MSAVPYPELLDLRLDEAFVASLRRFLEPFERLVSWRALSKIPYLRREGGLARRARDLVALELAGQYGYLAKASTHDVALTLTALREGVSAVRIFDFLCMNYAVDERVLSFAYTPSALDAFVAEGVLLRRGSALMLPVTIVPFEDRWFIADSWHLKENRERYGVGGAPLDFESELQIRYLRSTFGTQRRFRRFLEIGTGTGIVMFNVRAFADQCEGGEYDPRNLAFARANHTLCPDANLRFFPTDLLSGATGEYDLITFSPWQPTDEYLDLPLRFVEQAAAHLAPDGQIVLFVSHERNDTADTVLGALSEKMAALGLCAEQDVVNTFGASRRGEAIVMGQSFLRIRWAEGRRSEAGRNITLTRTVPRFLFEGRQLAERVRARLG